MKLNGKEIKNKNIKTLMDIIILYNYDIKNIAILVNDQVVKKKQWKSYKLSKNDEIEIIGFVGGG
ncbi:MAG: sulfur carrier protein ThiS [Candidatus Goldbacteria bacterium]|nr:sulfur carrier protein ThiS [Candidatus Goldiibacteriota bacterium]